uniref:VWFA domain-containing protein n=1 Tax=Ditylenchus dipsaci TaxID=166011 RepID=A0A915EI39_9BILA
MHASISSVFLQSLWSIIFLSTLVSAVPIDNGLIDSELVKECLTNNTVDVVLLLDGSGSIGDDTFQLQLNFAGHLARRLNVTSTGSHLAIVQFAESPQLEISLNQFTNPNQLESAIRRIKYLSGATNTGQALHFALENGFQGARGGSVPKVVIVVTDGQSQDDVSEPSQRLRDGQVLLYAIGVTNLVNVHQLHQSFVKCDEFSRLTL